MWSVDALDELVGQEVHGSERLEAALLAFARVRGLTFEESTDVAGAEIELGRLLPLVVGELAGIEKGRDGLVDNLRAYAVERGLLQVSPVMAAPKRLSALDAAATQAKDDDERDEDER